MELVLLAQHKGWELLRRIFQDHYADLLSAQELADTPVKAFERVKITAGFGQALDIISRISSREGAGNEDEQKDSDADAGRSSFARSRAERRTQSSSRTSGGPDSDQLRAGPADY